MQREYPFQVIAKPALAPEAVPFSGTEMIGRAIQGLLTQGLQTAASGIQYQAQQRDKQNTIMEAAGKLAIANDHLREQIGLAKVQQDVNASQNELQAANTLLSESEDKRRELEKKVELGLAATLASKPLSEVEALISRGKDWILDPEALAFAEELYGKRLAQEDLGRALDTIGVEVQKNPNVSFSQVIDGVASQRQFASPQVAASYLSTLRGNADRYFTSKQLEATEQRLKEGVATLGLDTIHKWTFDLKEGKLDGFSMLADIQTFVGSYKKLKPAASDLEVLAATSDVLNSAFNKDYIQANLPQMQRAYASMKALGEVSPEFAPVISALGDRITQTMGKLQAGNADILKAGIDGATDAADLGKQITGVELLAHSGEISPAKALELRNQAADQARKIQTRQDVLSKANGANVPMLSEHDKYIDEYMTNAKANVQQATGRPWTFAEEVAQTFRTFGVLSDRQAATLNQDASTAYDPKNPQALDVATQALQGVAAMAETNPTAFAQYLEKGKLSEKLATGYRLYRDLNVPIREIATTLVPMPDGYLSEAKAILEGKVPQGAPTGDLKGLQKNASKLLSIDDIVRETEENDRLWYNWVDYNNSNAVDAFKSSFQYEYAKLRQQSMDPAVIVPVARAAAEARILKNYSRVYLDGDSYLVNAGSPLAEGSEAQKATNETVSRLWAIERSKIAARYWNTVDDPDKIHLDVGSVRRIDGQLVFRVLTKDGAPLPRMGPGTDPYETFSVSADPLKVNDERVRLDNEAKARMEAARKATAEGAMYRRHGQRIDY